MSQSSRPSLPATSPSHHPRYPEQGQREKQGPDEVELLLDRERPVVQQRRRRLALGEVVEPACGEVEVRREPSGVEAVVDGLARSHEVHEEVRGDVGRHQRQHRGRQDPPRAANVEPEQRDRPGLARLGEQQARDQEAREDEEDVDADVPAGHRADARVGEDDEQHGDGAKPLNVLAVRKRGRRRRRPDLGPAGTGDACGRSPADYRWPNRDSHPAPPSARRPPVDGPGLRVARELAAGAADEDLEHRSAVRAPRRVEHPVVHGAAGA